MILPQLQLNGHRHSSHSAEREDVCPLGGKGVRSVFLAARGPARGSFGEAAGMGRTSRRTDEDASGSAFECRIRQIGICPMCCFVVLACLSKSCADVQDVINGCSKQRGEVS